MNVKCYTVLNDTVYSGIDGSLIGVDSPRPIDAVSISSIRSDKAPLPSDIGDSPWETSYTFTPSDDATINRGGLLHVSLGDWLPCPQLGDQSILMDVFNDGTGLIYLPRMGGVLRSNSNGLFLVSGNSGKPEIGLSGPSGVMRRTYYRGVECKPRIPDTVISPEISELVSALKTYRDTLKPLPLIQEQVSTDPQHTQES